MGKYREAAEVLFKRQFGIYGLEKIKYIAEASGYEIDSYGKVLYVENEKEAFEELCGKIKADLGPIAVIGSKIALLSFFSRSENAEQEIREAFNGTAQYSDKLKSYMGPIGLRGTGKDLGLANSESGSRPDNVVYAADNFRRIYDDCILLLDGDFKVLEANGNFLKDYRQHGESILGKKICDLMECASGRCPAGDTEEGWCPVKKAFKLMKPVETHITVNGNTKKWRTFPFLSEDAAFKKALVHIMGSPAGVTA